jgi:hypothetical protein
MEVASAVGAGFENDSSIPKLDRIHLRQHEPERQPSRISNESEGQTLIAIAAK